MAKSKPLYLLSIGRGLVCGILLACIAFRCEAQPVPDFDKAWNKIFQTPRTYLNISDANGLPGHDWSITLTTNKLITSGVPGYVTLQYVRAWVYLPTSAPKDPLAGQTYTLSIQLDMLYNETSRKSYDNPDSPVEFLFLPQTMIINYNIDPSSDIGSAVQSFADSVVNGPSAIRIAFYQDKVPSNFPIWKISSAFEMSDLPFGLLH